MQLGLGGSQLGTILVDLADAGADVRVIAATPRFAIGTEGLKVYQPQYWLARAVRYFDAWKAPQANIRAVRTLRAYTRNTKMPLEGRVLMDWGGYHDSRHEKATVIYSAATGELHAFVGGIDYEPDRFADEWHLLGWWHDAGVQLQGAAANEVLSNFYTRWIETATLPDQRYMLDGVADHFNPTIEPTDPVRVVLPSAPLPTSVGAGSYLGAFMRVLRSYDRYRAYSPWLINKNIPWNTLPGTGVREIETALTNAIDRAQNYIYVEDQTLNPSALTRPYQSHSILYPHISAACASGVKVIFVTQGFVGPNAATPANLSMSPEITELILAPLTSTQRENFVLYYVKDTKVHSKLVIVDDEFVSIGSANFWNRSMTGDESELTAMIVHPGESSSLAADLRVRLWQGHLRVSDPSSVDAELRDLSMSLGLFRSAWGTGVTFPHPDSALVQVPA